MRCINGEVELISPPHIPYQVCAEEFCRTYGNPLANETMRFPPEVILHDHQVRWKFTENETTAIIEINCPATPFCQNIDCIFCSIAILNPECWPTAAIIAVTILLYLVISGCYVFLYVPITLGWPLRVLTSFICRCLRSVINGIDVVTRRTRRGFRNPQRPVDLIELLAVLCIFTSTMAEANGCQQVDVFSHVSTVCSRSDDGQTCKVQLSEVLKINPFKRQACFKLHHNSTSLHEIHVQWKSLILLCEPVTDVFTRETNYNVVDSKRRPHTGSCKGGKCADINATSLIPELEHGNKYPGITACVESCGGLGCDCFYWSSGCLFYRIYLTPNSPQVYEIFHCNRWRDAAKVEITHFDAIKGTADSYLAHLRPNIPVSWKFFTLALSSITVPPIPLLNLLFISDGNHTAIWHSNKKPALQCPNHTAAKNLDCDIVEDCTCYPAETQANCKCRQVDISSWFDNIQHRLPVVLPPVTFRQTREGQVQATISSMTTSEIILSIKDNSKTTPRQQTRQQQLPRQQQPTSLWTAPSAQ
ncbi:hypothetical protein ANCCEY_03668 [Ancylostoma ceylanicum]|uniref:Phlebovirus glycoprotein G2 fusion domain-containing protein n=2 Tax=Ancylostoma ceylanicum TaxID=53326 RepID=A0A016VRZ8_9BILA|nr:hypothetical protein ANCCEY_03668 [Ancylostoma ceylanicum]EYC30359.1 hypothetical protein Y032_0005g2606 [Ancylostoma ceylanicum]